MKKTLFLIFLSILVSNSAISQIVSDHLVDSLLTPEKVDSLDDRKFSIKAYPYIFYTPETEVAFGAGGIMVFYTNKDRIIRPSKVSASAFYTSNKQYKFSVKSSIYLLKNKLYIETPFSFGSTLDKYWGTGNKTEEIENKAYLREDLDFNVLLQAPPILFFADYTGINFEYNRTNIIDDRGNPYLADTLTIGRDGGEIFGIGLNLSWERRDHIFYPSEGYYQTFKIVVHTEPGDFVYTSFELDARYYTSINEKIIWANNVYYNVIGGEAPFYKLPSIGGQNRMRGFFKGRFRDRNAVVVQTEFRYKFAKRWGVVAFGGIGDVGEYLTDLSIKDFKYSFGSGLRFLFNKKEEINIRMDIGYASTKDIGIYFGLEEAF